MSDVNDSDDEGLILRVVLYKEYGGFHLPEELKRKWLDMYGFEFDDEEISRHDPRLVALVSDLGGRGSLKVVEVLLQQLLVEEYDGMEYVGPSMFELMSSPEWLNPGQKKFNIILNKIYGGFGVSDELKEAWRGKYGFELNVDKVARHDSRLVDLVNQLKERANGPHAHLEVVQVTLEDPEDGYRLSEYDGFESHETKNAFMRDGRWVSP